MYGHKYTDAEKRFFREFVPGHSYEEIRNAFEERFVWPIGINQIKAYIGNNGLSTGRTGRFEKGHEPANKGKKGKCASGCEKTWFKKGHMPKNHRPVGSERISKDGYIEIKVEEPNKWRVKHRVIWEKHRGEIPKNSVIIFADRNKQNVTIENLRLIDRGTHAVINHEGLALHKGEFKDTAIAIATLKRKTTAAKKKKR